MKRTNRKSIVSPDLPTYLERPFAVVSDRPLGKESRKGQCVGMRHQSVEFVEGKRSKRYQEAVKIAGGHQSHLPPV